MNQFLIAALLAVSVTTVSRAQDQTVNGDLYIGAGSHDQLGYGKRINFIGNSDNCYVTRFNIAPNQTEFRISIGDDNEAYDKFTIGITDGNGQYQAKMVVQGDGKVGIGTNMPQSKLEVEGGDIKTSGNLIVSSGNATGGGIKLADDGDIVDLNDGWATHRFSFGLRVTNANSDGQTVIQLANGVNNNVTYFNSGDVGIGTTNPQAKLGVNGLIRAKAVKVETANFPDYVFKPSYRLQPLSAVKAYIDKNHHLPEVPSEAESIKNGINLGEMNKLLLKKVEELTLHLIKQERRIRLIEASNKRK